MEITNQEIACARCGDENALHHYRVEVFDRKGEDCDDGLRVAVENGKMTVGTTGLNGKANPSGRRDGVRIMAYCEHCDDLTEITVVRHKGTTYLSTKAVAPPDHPHPKYREDA